MLVISLVVLPQRIAVRTFAPAFLLTLLIFTPVAAAEILTGGDHLANSLAVTTGLFLVLTSRSSRQLILSGLLFGLALSWRAHFLLVAVPLLTHFVRGQYPRPLLISGVATVLSWTIATLPFWMYDPEGFTPFQVQQKLSGFSDLVAGADLWPVLLSIATGIALGLRLRTPAGLLIACGVTVSVPILAAVLFNSLQKGTLTLELYGWYILTATVPIALGVFLHLTHEPYFSGRRA